MGVPTTIAVVIARLGSALVSGNFFAFPSFVMRALARVPASEEISAMRSINVVLLCENEPVAFSDDG